MNAADDKENNKPPLNNKPTVMMNNQGCSNIDKNETKTQIKLNGSSHQSIDSNDQITALPLSNGTNGVLNSDGALSLPSTSNCVCLPNCTRSETGETEISNRETEDQPLPSDSNIRQYQTESIRPTMRPVQNQCHVREVSNYDANSSSEDEECCIYTYKGDSNQSADLHSSFFRLDSMPPRQNNHSGNSSPEMDYLEMDFDPGPSNGKDSSSSSECGEEMRDEGCFPENFLNAVNDEEALSELEQEEEVYHSPSSPVSTPSPLPPGVQISEPTNQPSSSADPVGASQSFSMQRVPTGEEDVKNDVPQSYCSCVTSMEPSFHHTFSTSLDENFNDGEAGTMVMKERDAEEKQVNQFGPSASGATAVVNALIALDVPYSMDSVEQLVATRLRDEQAPLPQYLISRSSAGSTHEDVIRGLRGDLVYARFFHTFPARSVVLTSWLSHWIRKGAVPILTLNPQHTLGHNTNLPDSWQHRTVYGVSVRGVHLTNPLETVPETTLKPQLASPPTLLVRRADVLSRYTPATDLHQLIDPTLPDWRRLNVLGQVAHVIRESVRMSRESTSHVRIPSACSCGVTFAMLRSNPACDELRSAPELPVDPFAAR